ncbi:MAG: SPOR domain-containing protein [Brevundimonas sp.]|nr:MAG: SPOR domain-containing protein [Brevundimonas sp.]
MTASRTLRPVVLLLAGLCLASCGMVEGDPHRFEGMAQAVADIPLDGGPQADAPPPDRALRTAAENGLRPVGASRKLQVEVLDPHALWDARDAEAAGLRPAFHHAAEVAAPAVGAAVVREAVARIASPAAQPDAVERSVLRTVQIGAYSSRAAAEAAWTAVRKQATHAALDGASPTFETVNVDGRRLVRLRVAAPERRADLICRAAAARDPWCLSHH